MSSFVFNLISLKII